MQFWIRVAMIVVIFTGWTSVSTLACDNEVEGNKADRGKGAKDKLEDVRDAKDDARKEARLKELEAEIARLKAEAGDAKKIKLLEARANQLRRNLRRDKREDVRDQERSLLK